MGRTTSYYRRVGRTKIIQWINSCPSLYSAANNKEIHWWIVVITWIITEWVLKRTGASLWIDFDLDNHTFFSITALGHMKYANLTSVIKTCKHLNHNKHSNWSCFCFFFWLLPQFVMCALVYGCRNRVSVACVAGYMPLLALSSHSYPPLLCMWRGASHQIAK